MLATVIHTLSDKLELLYKGQELFTYVYNSKTPARESPKPYFHPLKTLAGNEVSIFRPHDHLWHTGLTMTVANLSGENFWGGNSYTREHGYIQLDNNGHMRHESWEELSYTDTLRCIEQLTWLTHEELPWIAERREIRVSELQPEAGYWSLGFVFEMKNIFQQPLDFGSPTTAGRPNAGYGGLFWRGPRSFLNGKIIGASSVEGPEALGQRSPWLAFIGKHDGNQEQSTLLFIDQPENPRYPNKWFVRNDPYACISCSCMFDEIYRVEPGETLRLAYKVVIANGAWDRARIEDYLQQSH